VLCEIYVILKTFLRSQQRDFSCRGTLVVARTGKCLPLREIDRLSFIKNLMDSYGYVQKNILTKVNFIVSLEINHIITS
jgi:hypothetical protein